MTKGWPGEFEAVEAEQWGSETPPDPRVVLDQLAQTPEAAGLHEVAAYSVGREMHVVALLVVLAAIVAAIGAVVIVMALS